MRTAGQSARPVLAVRYFDWPQHPTQARPQAVRSDNLPHLEKPI